MFAIIQAINNEEDIELQRQQRQLQLLKKILRDSSNPFDFPNRQFIAKFRLNKYLVRYIIDELQHVLPSHRRQAVPLEIKVFAFLSFCATGLYQRVAGSVFYLSMSQSKMSMIIHEISHAIYTHLVDRWIVFPSTDAEKQELQQFFFNASGVQNVIGAVDGTLINILAPTVEEHNYINRKGTHSINVQIVCDYTLRILSVNARFPGSAHDAYIWRNSQVQNEMREHFGRGSQYVLLGDSGYPTLPWLLTPVRNAQPNTPEYRYTRWHSKQRSCVERCIGKLKQRFRCLGEDNRMRYSPAQVGKIATVAACLHNMCIVEGLDIINNNPNEINIVHEEDENENEDEDIDINLEYADLEAGIARRQNIIDQYFE